MARKMISIRLREDLHATAVAAAARQGKTLSRLVEEMLENMVIALSAKPPEAWTEDQEHDFQADIERLQKVAEEVQAETRGKRR